MSDQGRLHYSRDGVFRRTAECGARASSSDPGDRVGHRCNVCIDIKHSLHRCGCGYAWDAAGTVVFPAPQRPWRDFYLPPEAAPVNVLGRLHRNDPCHPVALLNVSRPLTAADVEDLKQRFLAGQPMAITPIRPMVIEPLSWWRRQWLRWRHGVRPPDRTSDDP